MGVEENKALVRRFVEEVLNRRRPEALAELVAPTFAFYYASRPDPMTVAGFQAALTPFHAGFPDITFTLEALVAEGDLVTARFMMQGTHRGAFQGIAPTGTRATWRGLAMFRIAADRIAEEWATPDVLGLLQQLGVIPSLEQAPSA